MPRRRTAATPGQGDPAPSTRERAGGWEFDVRAGAYAGAFDGLGVRRDSGGLLLVDGALTPSLLAGRWKLDVPLRFDHRETPGADLSETSGSAGLAAEYRVSRRLRVGPEVGIAATYRPDWPDLYQRDATGAMPGTDRYSYRSWRAGVALYARPMARNHLRLAYRYVSYTFREDPSFDPAAPMHLTPRDNGQHQLDASWRILGDPYAVAFRVDYVRRQDETLLARDGRTGATTGNPKQELAKLEPSVEVELSKLGGALDLSFRYGYEVQDDTFDGYYSYQGHHPRLVAKYAFAERLAGELALETWLRTYGPDSKANTSDGGRLFDRKVALRGELRYELARRLALRGEAEWVRRDTNYPDYVPGVYPATRFYDVRWDYDNVQAIAGIEYRL